MDLGIAGRKAIVCASSRGLGRACAEALAQAGCEVVINGLDAARLETTAADIRKSTGAKITPVAGDLATPDVQAALFRACPDPDILVNNNAGPPPREFRDCTQFQRVERLADDHYCNFLHLGMRKNLPIVACGENPVVPGGQQHRARVQ